MNDFWGDLHLLFFGPCYGPASLKVNFFVFDRAHRTIKKNSLLRAECKLLPQESHHSYVLKEYMTLHFQTFVVHFYLNFKSSKSICFTFLILISILQIHYKFLSFRIVNVCLK